MICIRCPRGCHLEVDETRDYAVTGNACPRGAEYGRNECLHPVRTVTATVACRGGSLERLPVKTDRSIPKERMMEVIRALGQLTIFGPVRMGDALVSNVCGTGANIVATRTTAQTTATSLPEKTA